MKPLIKTIKGSGLTDLLIISGVHGNESNAVIISSFLMNNFPIDILPLYRKITFLIGLNEYGLINNVRDTGNLYSTQDLNRAFSSSDRPEEIIREQIASHNIVIDIHNSPNCMDSVLFSLDEYSQYFIDWAINNKIPYIFWNKNTPTIKSHVNSFPNKVGFTVEITGMGFDVFYSMEESAGPDGFMSQVPEILMKVLRNPPNYSEKKAAPIPEIIHNLLCRTIVSVREGLFYTIFGCGDWVWQGRFIGMICDYEGNVVESVVSPIDGVIVELPESFYIPASGAICMIQPASSCF